MGYRIHTLVIHGKDPQTIHQEYGVSATGEFIEIPDEPVLGAVTPGGGYQLFVNDENLPGEELLQTLSTGGRLAVLWVNETVMSSCVWCYENGQFSWSISHDSNNGLSHVDVEGDPPAAITPIRESLLDKQNGCDDVDYLFDLPLEAFILYGGVDYNKEFPDGTEEPWEILERLLPSRQRPWWRWW